jgi:hypothetical protein
MAHWDSERGVIVRWPTEQVSDHPGWEMEDCGCCNGIEWNGNEPRECHDCCGNGIIYHHKKSGVLASYIGGPFVGRRAKGKASIPQQNVGVLLFGDEVKEAGQIQQGGMGWMTGR